MPIKGQASLSEVGVALTGQGLGLNLVCQNAPRAQWPRRGGTPLPRAIINPAIWVGGGVMCGDVYLRTTEVSRCSRVPHAAAGAQAMGSM